MGGHETDCSSVLQAAQLQGSSSPCFPAGSCSYLGLCISRLWRSSSSVTAGVRGRRPALCALPAPQAREPEPLLVLLDTWAGLLPPALHSHILEALVFPKVGPVTSRRCCAIRGRARYRHFVLLLQATPVGRTAFVLRAPA